MKDINGKELKFLSLEKDKNGGMYVKQSGKKDSKSCNIYKARSYAIKNEDGSESIYLTGKTRFSNLPVFAHVFSNGQDFEVVMDQLKVFNVSILEDGNAILKTDDGYIFYNAKARDYVSKPFDELTTDFNGKDYYHDDGVLVYRKKVESDSISTSLIGVMDKNGALGEKVYDTYFSVIRSTSDSSLLKNVKKDLEKEDEWITRGFDITMKLEKVNKLV